MTIKFDRSAETGILITCTSCDYWFSYRFNQVEAYDSGAAHALRAHEDNDESKRVGDAKSQWLKQEAKRLSRKLGTPAQDAPHGNA